MPDQAELPRRGGFPRLLLRIVAEHFEGSIKALSGRLCFAEHRSR